MKRKQIVCFIVFVIAIIVTAVSVSNIGYLKTRLYFGDRITGTFVLTVGEEKYIPTEQLLEYENEVTQKLNLDAMSSFSIKGGKYGSYKIGFLLDNEELYRLTGDEIFRSYETNPTLIFQYINTNWWHITEISLSAEMVMIDGEWVVNTKVVYSESNENRGISEYSPIEKSVLYSELMSKNGIVQFGV